VPTYEPNLFIGGNDYSSIFTGTTTNSVNLYTNEDGTYPLTGVWFG